LSGNEKIEIEYKPIRHVTIIDCTKLTLKDLSERFAALMQMGQPIPLQWAEGIAFFYIPMPLDTDYLIERYLKGEAIWQSVIYALMPKYSPKIKVGGIEVPVLDGTSNRVYREIAKWLKKHAENED